MFAARCRRRLVIAGGLTFAVLLVDSSATHTTAAQAPARAARPPNIVLYLADDIGREAFASYGGTSYKTPHIDRLAADGIRFDRAYATFNTRGFSVRAGHTWLRWGPGATGTLALTTAR